MWVGARIHIAAWSWRGTGRTPPAARPTVSRPEAVPNVGGCQDPHCRVELERDGANTTCRAVHCFEAGGGTQCGWVPGSTLPRGAGEGRGEHHPPRGPLFRGRRLYPMWVGARTHIAAWSWRGTGRTPPAARSTVSRPEAVPNVGGCQDPHCRVELERDGANTTRRAVHCFEAGGCTQCGWVPGPTLPRGAGEGR